MRIESEQLFFFVIVYQRPPSLNDAAAPAPIISYIILSSPPSLVLSPLYPSFPIISGAALHCLLFDVIYDMAYIPSSTVPPLSFGLQNEY